VGTPFMGYRGAVYLLQEIVNRLYEVLFNFLPVDSAYSKSPRPGATNGATKPVGDKPDHVPGNLPWQPEAKAALDAALDKLPFLPRISASREIQMQAELAAHEAGLPTVTAELIQQVLAARKN